MSFSAITSAVAVGAVAVVLTAGGVSLASGAKTHHIGRPVTGAHLVSGRTKKVLPNGGVADSIARCPNGQKVIGTGAKNLSSNNSLDAMLNIVDIEISPKDNRVTVIARNDAPTNGAGITDSITAQAICAK